MFFSFNIFSLFVFTHRCPCCPYPIVNTNCGHSYAVIVSANFSEHFPMPTSREIIVFISVFRFNFNEQRKNYKRVEERWREIEWESERQPHFIITTNTLAKLGEATTKNYDDLHFGHLHCPVLAKFGVVDQHFSTVELCVLFGTGITRDFVFFFFVYIILFIIQIRRQPTRIL